MLTVGKDPLVVERKLVGRQLRCPDCGDRLTPWGHARARIVFGRGVIRWRLRPRRARCEGCGVTHVLLPVNLVWRRRDEVEVIGDALVAAACGQGHRSIAAGIGRPPATIRSWIRRLRDRAESLRTAFTALAVQLDPDAPPIAAAGSPLADAVTAILAVAAAAVARWGRAAFELSPWEVVCAVTCGMFLAPSITCLRINTKHTLVTLCD